MGDVIVIFSDGREERIVEAGKVTRGDGVIFPLQKGESLMVNVNEHDNKPGIADIRVEMNRKIKTQAQLFYGQLAEGNNIPFEVSEGVLRVSHKEAVI